LRAPPRAHRPPPLPPQQVTAARPEGLLQVQTRPFVAVLSGCVQQALRTAGLGKAGPDSQFLKRRRRPGPGAQSLAVRRLQWMRPALKQLPIHPAADPLTDPADRRGRGGLDLQPPSSCSPAPSTGSARNELAWRSPWLPFGRRTGCPTLEQRPAQLDVDPHRAVMPADLDRDGRSVTQLCRVLGCSKKNV